MHVRIAYFGQEQEERIKYKRWQRKFNLVSFIEICGRALESSSHAKTNWYALLQYL